MKSCETCTRISADCALAWANTIRKSDGLDCPFHLSEGQLLATLQTLPKRDPNAPLIPPNRR